MTKLASIAVIVALAACDKDDPPASTAAEPAAETAAGDTATATEPTEPTGVSDPDGPSRDEVRAFCVANYDRMMECIDDQAFWNVMATLYFQTDPQLQQNPAAKEPWIDMMKDAARTLKSEGQLEANCDGTVDNNQWPTQQQMQRVEAARGKSCAEFGNAYGYMMFGEGVFFSPTSDEGKAAMEEAHGHE